MSASIKEEVDSQKRNIIIDELAKCCMGIDPNDNITIIEKDGIYSGEITSYLHDILEGMVSSLEEGSYFEFQTIDSPFRLWVKDSSLVEIIPQIIWENDNNGVEQDAPDLAAWESSPTWE
jgi:hypothetical protein